MTDESSSVCILAPPDTHGGIGRYADQLADHLRPDLAAADHEHLFEELHPREYLRAALRATEYDVVHLHFEYGLFRPKLLYAWLFLPIMLVFSRVRGTPVVVTVHEVWTPATVGRFQYVYVWFVHALLALTAGRLVFMTGNAEADFQPQALASTSRIPHGVDTGAVRDINVASARAKFGLDSDDRAISQIGYVSQRKGTETFLGLAKRHPEYEFLVAGGPLREEDEPYFERISAEAPENVQLTGVLSDRVFHEAFVATDVAVLAYQDIRQSGILNWCFAYGVPAVCRAIDRFEELSDRGAPLFLFAEDDPSYPSIDTAVQMALAERDSRGAEMRSFGDKYSLGSVASEYDSLYASLSQTG